MNNDWETRYFDFTFTLKGLSSTEVERAVKRFVTKERKIVRQETIDEDNKRFLGELRKIGSITLSCQHFNGMYVPVEELWELRDKVNKK